MNKCEGRISSKQAMFLIFTTIFAPLLWYFPNITSLEAKQAAWLASIPAFIIFSYIIKQLNYLIIKNPNLSLLEIFEKSTYKIIGKFYASLLLLYSIYFFSMFIRFISERLVSSVYPNVDCEVFILSILIILNLTLRSNITVIAKMNEIAIWLIIFITIVLITLLLSNSSIENITPLSYLDIIPVIKSSFYLNILGGITINILLSISQKIADKKNLIKHGNQLSFSLFILTILLLIGSMGVFGYYSLSKIPFSFMTVTKQLQLLGFLRGFDSVFITVWVISELIVLNVLILSFYKILEYLFNLKHITNFINIILIFIFISSKLFTKNFYNLYYEIQKLGEIFQVFIGVIFPIIFIWIYKIRFNKKRLLE